MIAFVAVVLCLAAQLVKADPMYDSGDWTAWSEWGPCPGDCEQDGARNYRYKTRDCISSSYHVTHCKGSRKSGEICNTDPCPIDGNWGAWCKWSTCTATCGEGVHSRTRQCDNPKPYNGGKPCTGNNFESGYCNTHDCPDKHQYDMYNHAQVRYNKK